MASTANVISSDRVEGTTVYNTGGDKLGTIDDLMIDKQSGQVRYAVLEFGGFLGIGTDRYPIPWSMLKYDTAQDGYVIPLDKAALDGAPRYADASVPDYDDQYTTSINRYYGFARPVRGRGAARFRRHQGHHASGGRPRGAAAGRVVPAFAAEIARLGAGWLLLFLARRSAWAGRSAARLGGRCASSRCAPPAAAARRRAERGRWTVHRCHGRGRHRRPRPRARRKPRTPRGPTASAR
jgi:sporulation protein YlmC with PRC-barrel domain